MLKKYDGLLNLEASLSTKLFNEVDHPWEAIPKIKEYIESLIPTLGEDYIEYESNVFIHKDAIIEKSALIKGPTIIGKNTEVRQCAFIRGSALIGENCVIGNSTEVKNSIIFNNVQCPHFNYIGDSVLGEYAHTGAGAILSNVKSDKKNIVIKDNDESYETNLRKMSAILGDHVDVGCNSVICPGTIIYPNTNVYPLTMVRGVIGKNKIVKSMNNIVDKEER